jgi:hypothetical protein
MTTNLTTITCNAPDEQTALNIQAQAQKSLTDDSAEIPWFGQSDDLQRDYRIYLKRKAAERQWDVKNQDYIINITHRSEVTFQRGNTAGGHLVLKEWREKKAADLSHVEALPEARKQEIRRIIGDMVGKLASPSSSVAIEGTRVTFRRIAFGNREMALTAVVAWLEAQGCRDVEVSSEEV